MTRIYFADETEANADDPGLARVPADRWRTLLAQPTPDGYTIDFRFQGPDETVFFDVELPQRHCGGDSRPIVGIRRDSRPACRRSA